MADRRPGRASASATRPGGSRGRPCGGHRSTTSRRTGRPSTSRPTAAPPTPPTPGAPTSSRWRSIRTPWRCRPVKVTAVCEVGRAIHPTLCTGQIEGGTLQALGWALMEEIKLNPDGRYLNDRLATYIIPTIQDSPRIDVHLLEQGWEGGPFGAKGVGELPMDGGAPGGPAGDRERHRDPGRPRSRPRRSD